MFFKFCLCFFYSGRFLVWFWLFAFVLGVGLVLGFDLLLVFAVFVLGVDLFAVLALFWFFCSWIDFWFGSVMGFGCVLGFSFCVLSWC